MKKIILVCCLCLLIVNISYAQTVIKLKSGKTIEGELIEKTDKYIKLKFHGVSLTYWIDEVESINDTTLIEGISPNDVYMAYLVALDNQNWQEIKKYLSKEDIGQLEETGDVDKSLKMLKMLMVKDTEVVEERIKENEAIVVLRGKNAMGQAKGTIEFIKEGGQWKISKEDWEGQGEPATLTVSGETKFKQGDGIISGTITLPNTDKKGNLYIHFSPAGQIISTPESERYYTLIKAEEIISNNVSYKVENVPEGSYWGFATWDLADPFWEPYWGEGNCPGYAGDYTGGTMEEIVVSKGQHVSEVHFECTRYLKPFKEKAN